MSRCCAFLVASDSRWRRSAGLDAADGDAIVVIDCDLQDPPELIPELVARWRDGYDVVYAQRRTRAGETLPKRIVAWAGYRVIKRIAEVDIPANTGDFRLMSRRVVDNVTALKEAHGYLRGLVGLVGFRQTSVLYDRDPRAAGTSKYNQLFGSLAIGLNGVVGFSRYPLQLISLVGIGFAVCAFVLAVVYLILKLAGVAFPLGNPTVVIVVAFFSGIQLLSLGVIGEYVGRIYDETRERPKYILESRYGWEQVDRRANGAATGRDTTQRLILLQRARPALYAPNERPERLARANQSLTAGSCRLQRASP